MFLYCEISEILFLFGHPLLCHIYLTRWILYICMQNSIRKKQMGLGDKIPNRCWSQSLISDVMQFAGCLNTIAVDSKWKIFIATFLVAKLDTDPVFVVTRIGQNMTWQGIICPFSCKQTGMEAIERLRFLASFGLPSTRHRICAPQE